MYKCFSMRLCKFSCVTCMCMRLCIVSCDIRTYVCVGVFVCTYIFAHKYLHIYTYACLNMKIFTCLYSCLQKQMCIHVYTNTHTYKHELRPGEENSSNSTNEPWQIHSQICWTIQEIVLEQGAAYEGDEVGWCHARADVCMYMCLNRFECIGISIYIYIWI